MLILAKQLGGVERISEPKVNELLDLKEKFGMGIDNRRVEDADLCVNTEFGRGFIKRGCDCGCGGSGGSSKRTAAMTPPPEASPVKTATSRGSHRMTEYGLPKCVRSFLCIISMFTKAKDGKDYPQ